MLAETTKVAASTKNGSENEIAINSAANGGPAKVLATCSMLQSRPLAFSRLSGWTIEGMKVCAELS